MNILILEDETAAGNFLARMFTSRGFTVTLIKSSMEAEQYLTDHPNTPPVLAILDINLGLDSKTGTEVGRMLQRAYPMNPPELIMYTAYNNLLYWQEATRMGAATYINKPDHREVITHTKVLCLRHYITGLDKRHLLFQNLAHGELSEAPLFHKVITELLLPQFKQVLGHPFYFLFSMNGTHAGFHSDQEFPHQHPLYATVQQKAEQMLPVTYEVEPLSDYEISCPIGEILKGSTLIRLYHHDGMLLTLGLKTQVAELGTLEENSEPLAKAFCAHLKPVWLERLFSLIRRTFQEEKWRQENLRMTTQMCLSLAEVQLGFYAEAETAREIPSGALVLPKIQSVATSLQKLGHRLNSLEGTPTLVPVDISEQVDLIWKELQVERLFPPIQLFCDRNIWAMGTRSDLRAILRRLLEWMANRHDRHQTGGRPEIRISVIDHRDEVILSIQDQSDRLPQALLDNLFVPFNEIFTFDDGLESWLGLFMSKMLVEMRLGGRLEENSHQRETPYGHLLHLRLRPISG